MRNSTRLIDVLLLIFSLLLLVISINSCNSCEAEVLQEPVAPEIIIIEQTTPTVETPQIIEETPVVEEAAIIEEPPVVEEPAIIEEPPVVEEPSIIQEVAEPEIVIEDPVPVVEQVTPPVDIKMVEKTAEYERSVSALSAEELVTEDKFAEDKKAILDTIEELTTIMAEMNYQEWLKYVSPASRKYWANPKNLTAVTNRLPIKGLKIRSMQDYFKYVFVPSRLNRVVDEIRYVSSSIVKAVQVKENQDIIFYYFEKINGKWLLKLDELES